MRVCSIYTGQKHALGIVKWRAVRRGGGGQDRAGNDNEGSGKHLNQEPGGGGVRTGGKGGRGAHISHLTIDHASLSRPGEGG